MFRRILLCALALESALCVAASVAYVTMGGIYPLVVVSIWLIAAAAWASLFVWFRRDSR